MLCALADGTPLQKHDAPTGAHLLRDRCRSVVYHHDSSDAPAVSTTSVQNILARPC